MRLTLAFAVLKEVVDGTDSSGGRTALHNIAEEIEAEHRDTLRDIDSIRIFLKLVSTGSIPALTEASAFLDGVEEEQRRKAEVLRDFLEQLEGWSDEKT